MKETLYEIICALKSASAGGGRPAEGVSEKSVSGTYGGVPEIDAAWLDKLVRRRNREMHDAQRRVAKKRLLPAYLRMRENEPETLLEWGVDAQIDAALIRLLKAKPRRTASGVATITVLTKPWPCSNDCLYCPNDVRMPKSYLADEPACQRAERNYFDPYLQVASRLRVLTDMGHVTDKIELIVLGGTFSDYPADYQTWFISELFRALNNAGHVSQETYLSERVSAYEAAGLRCEADDLAAEVAAIQAKVNAGKVGYNGAVGQLYAKSTAWAQVARFQTASIEDLAAQQRANENAAHRVVGLVVETRPDAISPASLLQLRQLGCTKIQMGIQSLTQRILDINARGTSVGQIERAFELLRLFGFKSHVHMMVNLPGATPESDRQEYLQLASDPRFIPDEVKLYPCALVESSRLMRLFDEGVWRPYSESELVDLLAADVLATPPYTRISRMIRDISATDIVAGNKKTNLRQVVEAHVETLAADEEAMQEGAVVREGAAATVAHCDENAKRGITSRETSADAESDVARTAAPCGGIQEMRMREIATSEVSPDRLRLECLSYATTVSTEYFLQWVTPENRLAGFLRLSLPEPGAVARLLRDIAALPGTAGMFVSPELAAASETIGAIGFDLAEGQAMIREVHVYGSVAALHEAGESAQHAGLGRKLIEAACAIARDAERCAVNVISAVGTREYYRNLGFADNGLYQTRDL